MALKKVRKSLRARAKGNHARLQQSPVYRGGTGPLYCRTYVVTNPQRDRPLQGNETIFAAAACDDGEREGLKQLV